MMSPIMLEKETFGDTLKLTWTEGMPTEIIINSPTLLQIYRFDLPNFNITINNSFSIDTAKCIRCGSCTMACPKDVMTLTIEKVNFTGEYQDIFWLDVIRRLKG